MKLCFNGPLNSKPAHRLWRLTLLLSIIISWPNLTFADSPMQIDQVTQQWLNIERQTTQLQTDWQSQSPVLQQRIALLKAEKQQLSALLSQNNASGNDVDSRREALLTEQNKLEQQQADMTRAIDLLVYTNKSMQPFLPPVLAKNWQQAQTGAAKPADDSTNTNNSENLQQALAQLTQLADFEQRISVHEDTVKQADGQTILVQQIFLGASTAWFVSRDGEQAGWGQAEAEGWVWHVDKRIPAAQIQKAIDIFQKRKAADWVSLPIQLAKPSTLAAQKATNASTALTAKNTLKGAQK